MASIEERLGKLISLSAEDRAELRTELQNAFLEADESDDTDGMESAIMSIEKIDVFNEVVGEIEAATAEVETSSDPDLDSYDESTYDEIVDEDSNTDSTDEAVEAEPIQEESGELAMAASAMNITDDALEGEIVGKGEVALVASIPVAGADISGMVAGAEFDSLDDMHQAFVQKINSVRGSHGGDGEKRTVVSLRASIGEDRQLSPSDTLGNMKLIDEIMGVETLVASGGYCAPLPVNYDIYGIGSNIRPVRDSLPTFGATRGGIRYIAPPVLGAYNAAISLWTAANDANPTSPAVKPSLKVNCAAELTATTDAVTLSLVFGNLMSRAYPELVQRHNQLALVQHARFAEQTLLNKISAASTPVTSAYVAGYGRDILRAISHAAAAYRNRNRVPRPVQLRAIMPDWVRDAIREDLASSTHFSALNESDSTIDSYLSSRGINVTWHIDDTFATQTSGGVLNGFPSAIKWWLFAEGTFLFLDGGILDLGVVRDSALIDTNDYRTFVETFEGVAKVGTESMQITTTTGFGIAPVDNVTGKTVLAP